MSEYFAEMSDMENTAEVACQTREAVEAATQASDTLPGSSVLALSKLANRCPSTSTVARFLHADYCHLHLSLLLSSLGQPSLARAASWRQAVARHAAGRLLRHLGASAGLAAVARPGLDASTVEQAAAAIASVDAWLLASCREVREEVAACPSSTDLLDSLVVEVEEMVKDSENITSSTFYNV